MAEAKQTHCMTTNETRNIAVSFSSMLGENIALTGTPTVTASPTGITLSNKKVNTAAIAINGTSVSIGEAVQFSAADPTAAGKYTITILCDTDDTPAETLEGEIVIEVE